MIDANKKPYKCQVENCGVDFNRSDVLKKYLELGVALANHKARQN
jgi:hypothetical protein